MSSLNPDITEIILNLAEVDQVEKKAKKLKSDLREQLFHVATIEGEKQVLPRRTTRLPVGFLNQIGMPENLFILSRWPGWRKLESRKVNDEGDPDSKGEWIEYLLEKDPTYLPYSAEAINDKGTTITAGRTVQQNPPEIDQRTLQKDMPEVFDVIMKPVVVYEVDTDKLEALLVEKPELLPKIQLHFEYPNPIAKLAPIREVKDDG